MFDGFTNLLHGYMVSRMHYIVSRGRVWGGRILHVWGCFRLLLGCFKFGPPKLAQVGLRVLHRTTIKAPSYFDPPFGLPPQVRVVLGLHHGCNG